MAALSLRPAQEREPQRRAVHAGILSRVGSSRAVMSRFGALRLLLAVQCLAFAAAAHAEAADDQPAAQPPAAQPPAAQPPAAQPPAARPRIGLVLSGGGARGAAHVGVLKVLEQLHVPIDAVAGTSMGAVVGGLYASGLSATDIETLLRTVDWQDAFSDRLPRRDLGFRRKQDEN